jgi:choline dehydrogenase-like flavoprotein
MSEKHYDVVIVGAGICGAILANELGRRGKRVLVLEAGGDAGMTPEGYQSYVERFYTSNLKVPNSPYPNSSNAPMPEHPPFGPVPTPPDPDPAKSYLFQTGPLPFGSDYQRTTGGTMLHWLGTSLRMLPEDFRLKSIHGQGVDWPLSYEDLMPDYAAAELEIGVSADVEDQKYMGLKFPPNYQYPMRKIPQSYLDRHVAKGLAGMKVPLEGREYALKVVSTPQGRNSIPNGNYQPVGAVGRPEMGLRCEGNANCVPICPVQAKYSALKTLDKAKRLPHEVVTLQAQAVASKIRIDSKTGRVTGIDYQRYDDPNVPKCTTHTARGTIYVIAAHAIETAKLLLASGVANSSDQVGRNLMDHPTLLTWALMPEPIGAYRGPGATSNIPTFRGGKFRKHQAAFILPLDNWGWSWSTFAPGSTVRDMVDAQNQFGPELRESLSQTLSRQFALQFEFEQLPEPSNRVTIDKRYLDALKNPRPVIQYDVSDYTRAAMKFARGVSRLIFKQLGIPKSHDFTKYDAKKDADYVKYDGEGYSFRGAGHLVGTHRMGSSKECSVVDSHQRSWDHPNLYLAGCGSMATIGTSNPTLTAAALAFRTAKSILKDLK